MEQSATPLAACWCRQSLGMSGCARDVSLCVWHLGERGIGPDFAGQKTSPSSNYQQGEQSPQLHWEGSRAGVPRVLPPPGAARGAPPLSDWWAKPATGSPGTCEKVQKKTKRTDRNRVSCAKAQVKRDTLGASTVPSPKAHKLIYVAAVNRAEPPRNPEFHL